METRYKQNPAFAAEKMIGTSEAHQAIERDIACAARSDAKVLITGESGVGKEVVSRLIHSRSQRNHRSFVALNCAGIPDSLLETELFGHERGSFTGAERDRLGMLEFANHGTLMLDEVGEMSMRMQALLLRFLETGEIQRVGSRSLDHRVDVRVVCATNRNLLERVNEDAFRRDLYYRLNVIHIPVPPLRERREDIAPMVSHFLRRQSERLNIPMPQLAPAVVTRFREYDWPGNVRELRNVIERILVRGRDSNIGLTELPSEFLTPSGPGPTYEGPCLAEPRQSLSDTLLGRMTEGGESFWRVVHEPLMARDLTRATLREVVTKGLERTRGSYRLLVELFNMRTDDNKRFLSILKKLDCYVAFQPFRVAKNGQSTRPGHGPLGERNSLK